MNRHHIFRDGRVHVCAEMCATCVFRPGNLMRLHPGRLREMIAEATANDSCIPCHSLLDSYTGNAKRDACCRGFFDRFPTQPLQIAERLGLVTYVDPNPGGPMLTDKQIETIDEINVLSPVTSAELARSMRLTTGTVRSRLQRLRRRGYAETHSDQINGQIWSLTDKGEDWVTAPQGIPLAEVIS